MKKRVALLGACLVFSIASFFYSSSSYVTYFSFITDIRKNTLAIEKLSQTNNDLQKEFEEVRGEDVPKNLKEVLDFVVEKAVKLPFHKDPANFSAQFFIAPVDNF